MRLTLRDEILVVADYEMRFSANILYKRVIRMRRENLVVEELYQHDFVYELLRMTNIEEVMGRWSKLKKPNIRGKRFAQVPRLSAMNPLNHFFRLTVKGFAAQQKLLDICASENNNFSSVCNLESAWNIKKKQGQS